MSFSASVKVDVLDQHIDLIIGSYFPEAKTSRNGNINFRCNVCGDSKKKKRKMRGWILKKKQPWMFYCFNCQEAMPAEIWMKKYFNSFYNDYLRDAFKIDIGVKAPPPPRVKPEELSGKEYNEYKDARYFMPIFSSNDEIFKLARRTCSDRLIPMPIWKRWAVAIDGLFKDRLIIPYFDKEGKIYSYQGRALMGQEPKYLSRLNCTDNIYNFYNVDSSKPVVILEGAIDSLFIENAIGCTGLKIHDERLKTFSQRYWLLDSDAPGKRVSLELLQMGEMVFLWDRFLKDNRMSVTGLHKADVSNPKWVWTETKEDVNAFIMKTHRGTIITFEEIRNYFSNNLVDKLYLT